MTRPAGAAAGPKAAAKITRLAPDADVTIIEKGGFLSYAGCGLPYYVSGVVEDQADLMSTPAGALRDEVFFLNVKNVHVHSRTLATEIDREARRVRVCSLQGGEERCQHARGAVRHRAAAPAGKVELPSARPRCRCLGASPVAEVAACAQVFM